MRRILIYRIGSLGDTIISLPGFHKTLEAFPDADITLLTNKPLVNKAAPVESVLNNGVFFHRVLNYPTGTRNPRLLWQLLREIRALKIDTVVNLATTRIMKNLGATKRAVWRDRMFFRAAGVKHLIGFPQNVDDYLLKYDEATGENEWEAKRLARRLAPQLGATDLNDDRYWDMLFTLEELATADDCLKTLDPLQPIIVASTGTKRQPNDWEEANWLELFRQLRVHVPMHQLVMLGAPDEADRAAKCLQIWGGGVNLCGVTNPRVSGAVLKRGVVFIGHDSGPAHLAAAVGTPCVAIYSARNLPRQWFIRGNNNTIIYHRPECAGCLLETCIEQKKKCILSITVNEVLIAVLNMLNKNLTLEIDLQ